MGYNDVGATKNNYCTKKEDVVNHHTVIRWLKKFPLGYQNLEDQIRTDRPKTVDSLIVLQARKANTTSLVS